MKMHLNQVSGWLSISINNSFFLLHTTWKSDVDQKLLGDKPLEQHHKIHDYKTYDFQNQAKNQLCVYPPTFLKIRIFWWGSAPNTQKGQQWLNKWFPDIIILSKMTHTNRVSDVISPKIPISNRKIIELENFQVKNLHFYISNINWSNSLKIAQLE